MNASATLGAARVPAHEGPRRVYQSVNAAVLARVPQGVKEVLDVGCGGGAFGAALKAERGGRVVGLTHSAEEAASAQDLLDEVRVVDLEGFDAGALGAGRFDCIVCSHVLEHLRAPEQLLGSLRTCLAKGGVLVVALPNVLFWRQRWQFVRGRFRYADGGLMDRTHLRFYDWESAAALVRAGGWRVVHAAADGNVPGARRLGPVLGPFIDRLGLARWPGLFGAQFVLDAREA